MDQNKAITLNVRMNASSPTAQFISGNLAIATTSVGSGVGAGSFANLAVNQMFSTLDDINVDSTIDNAFRVSFTPSAASVLYSFYLNDIDCEIR